MYDIFSFAVDVNGHSGSNQHQLEYGKRSLAYRGKTICNTSTTAFYNALTIYSSSQRSRIKGANDSNYGKKLGVWAVVCSLVAVWYVHM